MVRNNSHWNACRAGCPVTCLGSASLRKPTTCRPAAFSSAMAAGRTCLSLSFPSPPCTSPQPLQEASGSAVQPGPGRQDSAPPRPPWPAGTRAALPPRARLRTSRTFLEVGGLLPACTMPMPTFSPVQAHLRSVVARSWSPPTLPFMLCSSALA